MTWLLTSTGREHSLEGPGARHPDNAPTIEEIAGSLSQINRFTGHCNRPYSVAEHSLLAMSIAKHQFGADASGQLAALMHDAHECICGDVASPIKQVLGEAWRQFEALHEQHLRWSFGLEEVYAEHHQMVKKCDLIALATERHDLLPYGPAFNAPWPVLDTMGRIVLPWTEVDLCNRDRQESSPAVWAWIFEETASKLLATVNTWAAV
jgi:hypothetical protein